jgi:hypothetical protein
MHKYNPVYVTRLHMVRKRVQSCKLFAFVQEAVFRKSIECISKKNMSEHKVLFSPGTTFNTQGNQVPHLKECRKSLNARHIVILLGNT